MKPSGSESGTPRASGCCSEASEQQSQAVVDAEAHALVEALGWIAHCHYERPFRFAPGCEAIATAGEERCSEALVAPFRHDQREGKQQVPTVPRHQRRA